MIPSPEIKRVTILDYLKIVRNRIWLIIIPVIISIVVAAFIFSMEEWTGEEKYTATATLLFEEKPVLGSMQLTGVSRDIRPMSADVLIEYAKTYDFAVKVAAQLDRSDISQLLSMVDIVLRKKGVAGRGAEEIIVYVKATGTNSVEVAEIANEWAEQIIRGDIESRLDISEHGVDWLKTSRDEIGQKLERAEMELRGFMQLDEGAEFLVDETARQREQKNALVTELQELLLKYKEKHPLVVAQQTRIEILNAQMEEGYERKKSGKVRSDDDIAKYNLLVQQVETLRALFDEFAQSAEEADVAKTIIWPSVQVLQTALPPARPNESDPLSTIPKVLLFGLISGLGLCYLAEYLDTSIKIPEEVGFYLKLPFLGYIPRISVRGMGKSTKNQFVYHMKESSVAESLRNIKVSLLFASTEEEGLKSILVTSSIDGEGKTFVASNLAISFALAGEKTLLIDADLRKGVLGNSFDAKSSVGLSNVIQGEGTLNEAIIDTKIPNLSVLPAGSKLANASDILISPETVEIMKKLRTEFHRIIIDGVSVLNYADDIVIAKLCDGIIHVAAFGHTRLNHIEGATKKLLNEAGAPIIGVILNKYKP